MSEPGEFIMAVPPEGAALQFFTEAMKANTEMLKQVNMSMQGLQAEQKETLRTVQDSRERLIKLESNSHEKVLVELKDFVTNEFTKHDDRIETLERAQLVVDTRASSASYVLRNLPQITALLMGTGLIVYLILVNAGRI